MWKLIRIWRPKGRMISFQILKTYYYFITRPPPLQPTIPLSFLMPPPTGDHHRPHLSTTKVCCPRTDLLTPPTMCASSLKNQSLQITSGATTLLSGPPPLSPPPLETHLMPPRLTPLTSIPGVAAPSRKCR